MPVRKDAMEREAVVYIECLCCGQSSAANHDKMKLSGFALTPTVVGCPRFVFVSRMIWKWNQIFLDGLPKRYITCHMNGKAVIAKLKSARWKLDRINGSHTI
jgi:hypothetical protein